MKEKAGRREREKRKLPLRTGLLDLTEKYFSHVPPDHQHDPAEVGVDHTVGFIQQLVYVVRTFHKLISPWP